MKNTSFLSNHIVWISWQYHRRTEELCRHFGIKLYIVSVELPRLIRYPISMIKTIKIINIQKPKILIVQNPSIVLTAFACLIKKFFKFRLIVDAHNIGVYSEGPHMPKINMFLKICQKFSDLTIVTNKCLAKKVESNKGKVFILPDKIPMAPLAKRIVLSNKFNVAVVSTFDNDELYKEIFKVGEIMKNKVVFYVTGNYKKIPKKLYKATTENIVFTGYLSNEIYWQLLKSVNAVIDLTKLKDCLVCGAYEATAIGKPMLLTDTKVLKEHFSLGAIYCKTTVKGIYEGLNDLIINEKKLNCEIKILKRKLEKEWREKESRLILKLYKMILDSAHP